MEERDRHQALSQRRLQLEHEAAARGGAAGASGAYPKISAKKTFIASQDRRSARAS